MGNHDCYIFDFFYLKKKKMSKNAKRQNKSQNHVMSITYKTNASISSSSLYLYKLL